MSKREQLVTRCRRAWILARFSDDSARRLPSLSRSCRC